MNVGDIVMFLNVEGPETFDIQLQNQIGIVTEINPELIPLAGGFSIRVEFSFGFRWCREDELHYIGKL